MDVEDSADRRTVVDPTPKWERKSGVKKKRGHFEMEQVLTLRCKIAHFPQTSIIGTAIHCQCQLLDELRSKVMKCKFNAAMDGEKNFMAS